MPRRGPNPHLWKSGPDPDLHDRYLVWTQHRNQAQWRGELYNLSFDDWLDVWGDLYPLKGRTRDSMCMTRIDASLPWSKSNTQIVSRSRHAQNQLNRGAADGRFG